MEAISLYELNNRIKQTLKASFADSVWITAERQLVAKRNNDPVLSWAKALPESR